MSLLTRCLLFHNLSLEVSNMNKRKFFLLLYTFIIITVNVAIVNAQETLNSSGLTIHGSEGELSYSLGQFLTIHIKNEKNTLEHGVQLIFTNQVSDIQNTNIDGLFSICPIPTSDNIIVTVHDDRPRKYSYRLFSILGKLIDEGEINSKEVNISLLNTTEGIYHLYIYNEENNISSVTKIIKR